MQGGALEGVRVLEVTQIVAGPFCGQNLADLGADVVKVEPPGGEGLRVMGQFIPGESKAYHSLNRGKRSLVLNLQLPEAQEAVHRMIADFDVFLINSRAGVSARLKVDYDTLKQYRPDLIYYENTGYGADGPSAQRSGSDAVSQAYSGLLAGDAKVDEYGAPELITATAPGDYTAGTAGAMGICAALYYRERSGKGQFVSGSLLQGALAIQGISVGRLPAYDAMVTDPMLERLNEVRARGGSYQELMDARGDLFSMMGKAFRLFYGGFPVKDGAIILGALTPGNRDQMRRAMGIEGQDPTAAEDFDALDPANQEIGEQMLERVRGIMLTRTMDEWVALFDAEGAPISKVNIPEEMIDDPQVQAMGYILDLEHELSGPEQMPGAMISMSETPTGTEHASPVLGKHTDEVLSEHGFSEDEIAALRASGAAA